MGHIEHHILQTVGTLKRPTFRNGSPPLHCKLLKSEISEAMKLYGVGCFASTCLSKTIGGRCAKITKNWSYSARLEITGDELYTR